MTSGSPVLPLVVYFPTNRSVLDIPERIRTPHEFDALSAYDGAFEGGASNFRGFFEWFRQEEDIFNEQQLATFPCSRSALLRRCRPCVRPSSRLSRARETCASSDALSA